MIINKQIIVLCIISTLVIIPYIQIHAAVPKGITPYTIDHAKNDKEAKKWAEKQYEAWENTLSQKEKQSLEKLLDPIDEINEKNNLDHINHQLKVYGGDLSFRPVDIPKANMQLSKHIERINRALRRKEGKLRAPLIVYKNESLRDVIHTLDDKLKKEDETLDEEKTAQLKDQFLFAQYSEFRIFDLFENTSQTSTVKWKIHLPAGTRTGLVGETKIAINKDSALKIMQIRNIIQKGKQFLRIEAKLLDKPSVQNEISQWIEGIHNRFNTRLNLPQDQKFIDFKLTGSASYFIVAKLNALIDKMLTAISPLILNQTLKFMFVQGGHIILTDQQLYALPDVYEQEQITLLQLIKMMHTVGNYNFDRNRTVTIYLPFSLREQLEIDPSVLIHEFGHAVDNFGAKSLNTETRELSATPDFKNIFNKESKNLTEYATENPSEFFAEAFRMIHTPGQENTVKEKAPQTFEYIKKALEDIELNH